MPTHVAKYDTVAVLTSKEDLTRESIEQLKHSAEKCMDDGFHNLLIDFSHVHAIDSAGLEALLELQDRCEDKFGSVKLCAMEDVISKILDITRLIRRFESFADLDAGVRSFS